METIHFFRAGRHTAMNGEGVNFSDASIREIAASYDPARHEAPLVVGHPKGEAPAYGWVASIVAKDDGLYAVPRDVNPEFAELVKAGSYKKVSGSFYKPNAPGNPTPGQWHLRHIGFLGAQPPAVKGLRPIEFAADASGVVDFEEGTFDLREYRLEQAEQRHVRRETRQELDRLAKEARIHFNDIDPLMSFFEGLNNIDTVEFSDPNAEGEGSQKSVPQRQWFLRFLQQRLPIVHLGEIAATEFEESEHEFFSPENVQVDQDRLALRNRALSYAAKHGCTFEAAVIALSNTQR